MTITKYIITSVLSLFFCSGSFAQSKQEVSVYGSGGISALKYTTSLGKQENGIGGQFGLDYTYFFTEKIGFSSGLEIAIFNSKMDFDELSDKYMVKDIHGDEFEFRTKVTNYKEKQNTTYLNIPLLFRFETGKNNKFYTAAGGKIGIPLGGNYNVSSATIKNTGYYIFEDHEYTTQEFMGFGTFSDRLPNDEIKFKISFSLSTELGMKWKLKNGLFLYTGTYVDYGMNNILDESDGKPLVEYNAISPRDFIINSPLKSQYTREGKQSAFVEKVKPISIGIRLRLAFDVSSRAVKHNNQ